MEFELYLHHVLHISYINGSFVEQDCVDHRCKNSPQHLNLSTELSEQSIWKCSLWWWLTAPRHGVHKGALNHGLSAAWQKLILWWSGLRELRHQACLVLFPSLQLQLSERASAFLLGWAESKSKLLSYICITERSPARGMTTI